MRRIWAIAMVTMRSAIRSRVLITLGVLLIAAVVGLPLTVRGDGTVAGHVQLLLRYSLGAAFILLGITMVWSGCATLSTEVRNRQIHLVMTKPVHAVELWIGKWLGLLVMLAVMTALSGTIVYGLLRWTTRPGVLSEEETETLHAQLLVARQSIFPDPPNVEAEARAELRALIEQNGLPPGMSPEDAWDGIREHFRQRAFSVSPGGRTDWFFRVPPGAGGGRPRQLEFQFHKSVLDMEPVRGRWRFGEGAAAVAVEGAWRPAAVHAVAIPAAAWDGAGRLRVRFEHIDPAPAMLLFNPDDGLRILVYRGDFAGNFLRAVLVMFFRLAFLAALGLAAGTLLSLPVASFASVSAAFFIYMYDYIDALAQTGAFFAYGPDAGVGSRGVDGVMAFMFRVLAAVVRPLHGADPLDALASGRWVSPGWVSREALIQGLLYGGLLALGCAGLFRRRELGNAQG